jgi:hypothetical protein
MNLSKLSLGCTVEMNGPYKYEQNVMLKEKKETINQNTIQIALMLSTFN